CRALGPPDALGPGTFPRDCPHLPFGHLPPQAGEAGRDLVWQSRTGRPSPACGGSPRAAGDGGEACEVAAPLQRGSTQSASVSCEANGLEDDMAGKGFRIEHDSMGELQVPADALWGASTQRAVENFPVSGRPMPRG